MKHRCRLQMQLELQNGTIKDLKRETTYPALRTYGRWLTIFR